MAETTRRRDKQQAWNDENGITPESVKSRIADILDSVYEKDHVRADISGFAETGTMIGNNLKTHLEHLEKKMRDAAAAPQRDQPLGVRGDRQRYLDGVALAKSSFADGGSDGVQQQIEGGRFAFPKVLRKAAGAGAGVGKRVVKNTRAGKNKIEVAIQKSGKALFGCAGRSAGRERGREFFKLDGGNFLEQRLAGREMVIDGHGGDASGVSDAAHGDGLGAVAFEDAQSGAPDGGCFVVFGHLYSV